VNAFEEYDIGSAVSCRGERCGHLVCVVVDPVAERLTHLIVVARDGTAGRLVPVELAKPGADGIALDCSKEEFAHLEPSVATHFLNAADVLNDPDAEKHYGAGAGEGEVVYWPFYGLAPAGGAMSQTGMEPLATPHMAIEDRVPAGEGEVVYWPFYGLAPAGGAMSQTGMEPLATPHMAIEDRVPAGEVRIRRGEPVAARDGHIGHVRGLVVDPADESVTHVLLDEGHLWGHKRVAIPVGAVLGIDAEGVSVELTKHQIKDLPPVEVAGLD